jgi:hypothetical protein
MLLCIIAILSALTAIAGLFTIALGRVSKAADERMVEITTNSIEASEPFWPTPDRLVGLGSRHWVNDEDIVAPVRRIPRKAVSAVGSGR